MSKIINGEIMSLEIIDEKNCKEIINKISEKKDIKNLILFIDEDINMIDGISWIWCADFSTLINADKIYCCGKRNKDIFLKLKLDNLKDNIFLEYNYKKLLGDIADESKYTKIITSNWSKEKLDGLIIDDSV